MIQLKDWIKKIGKLEENYMIIDYWRENFHRHQKYAVSIRQIHLLENLKDKEKYIGKHPMVYKNAYHKKTEENLNWIGHRVRKLQYELLQTAKYKKKTTLELKWFNWRID